MRHPNIVRFLGYTIDQDSDETEHDVGVVYPWMEYDLRAYLRLNPDVDRYQLVRP